MNKQVHAFGDIKQLNAFLMKCKNKTEIIQQEGKFIVVETLSDMEKFEKSGI